VLTRVWCFDRSGPVHGVTSVQKAESGALANGSSIRGASKMDAEGPSHLVGKAERSGLTERDRLNGKPGVKYVFYGGCGLLHNGVV
jgi:hypothetical protein